MKFERLMDDKWIFQKNISSNSLIQSFLKVLEETKDIDKQQIQSKLRQSNAYRGRSTSGSLSTMGVRFSQMCFYMFGYKSSNDMYIPTQTTLNMINNSSSIEKNMMINFFSLQFPHPYSNTPSDFKIYVGRLLTKLLLDEKINKKLYIDEMIWFLPFIKTINENEYLELIDLILDYRKLSYKQKRELFESVTNYEQLFANCTHEINYYFVRIFNGFNVLNITEDIHHNGGNLFSFQHGKTSTYRKDSYAPSKSKSGFITLNPQLLDSAEKLVSSFSPFNIPTSMESEFVYSKQDWISDLYENEFIRYIETIFPSYTTQRNIISSLSNMTYMSKYSSVDGKDFESSLKPVFELFREILNVEIISGSGDTDLLCAVEDPLNDYDIYKINVDGKSRKSSNNINPVRLKRHLLKNNSRYCIIVAPRFSKGTVKDISSFPIVTISAEALAKYCSKECLSSNDYLADYIEINRIIEQNLGTDITSEVERYTYDKYGIKI